MKQSFILSSAGIQNIIFDFDGEDDFCFNFGDSKIHMKKYFAEFISPRVSKMLRSDPTLNILKVNDLNQSNFIFSKIFDSGFIKIIEQLSFGNPVEVNVELSHKLRIFSMLIENDEIYKMMNKYFPISMDKTKIDTCLEYLQNIDIYKIFNFKHLTFDDNQVFDLISANFDLIDESKLLKLPKSVLLTIISNPKLKIKSEDLLFDFINKLFANEKDEEEDIRIIDFYGQINIQLLSIEKFNEFIDLIELDEMTHLIWSKIKNFLIHSSNCDNEFNFNGNNRFEGIIHSILMNKPTDDTAPEQIIEVTSSSCIGSSTFDKKNVFSYNNDHLFFNSKNLPDSWFCYNFKNRKIKISDYSIRSSSYGGKGSCHLLNWKIEGSNDNENWKVLDVRQNEKSLDDCRAENTFQVNSPVSGYFQYIRIKQTGPNSYGDNQLTFSVIEFFGSIK
ncbi:hypothetical protein M9Y10_014436 [Tritrichomonas musculus]|uniref:F5/8 type C domain-containing protein n=1 Tax=Tritrichomonas musculus TaxID=1915356 RepID=A0ABR2KZH9_9EUKA